MTPLSNCVEIYKFYDKYLQETSKKKFTLQYSLSHYGSLKGRKIHLQKRLMILKGLMHKYKCS